LVQVIGYDVGGANTKAALVYVKKGKLINVQVAVEYFPIWKEPEKLTKVLLKLKKQLVPNSLDGIGLTMTAELSDVYQTKREGVNDILNCVSKAFPDVPVLVLNTEAKLITLDVAKKQPLAIAAANWAATGWVVTKKLKDCVVVDVGSTSTSIIPIVKGKVVAIGKTDLDKLICGELVYTGSLRTNVAAIIHSIPIRNDVAGVASELFALSGDVHLVLGNITQETYSIETADGRGKTIPEALARLARVVCADTEILTKQEIIKMAEYISDMQIRQVAEGLSKVYSYTKSLASGKVPVVVTGLGKNFIAQKAAEKLCVDEILELGTMLSDQAVLATPAFGVALMAANKLEGRNAK
jgi:(4-(4-[2-(gamma-L-glutamylamino)ethyl]phenoxymethyl)furan-2-yl)methanamine synthase